MRRRASARSRVLSLSAYALLAATSAMGACAPTVEDPERIARPGTPGRVAIEGGLWFDGQEFAPGTVYVEDGIFVERLSAEPDSVIDLAGGYVLPPFGDGHTHMLDGGPQMDAFVEQYEADGI